MNGLRHEWILHIWEDEAMRRIKQTDRQTVDDETNRQNCTQLICSTVNKQPNTIDGSLIKSTNVPHRAEEKKYINKTVFIYICRYIYVYINTN